MKENHFCRCCLSTECYKDMANEYYIGDKTENYVEMLANTFDVNITNMDGGRSLICEECVSKLRKAEVFKKQVLDVQEAIKNNFSWDNSVAFIDAKRCPKTENADDCDDYNDDVSDFNDNDIMWDDNNQSDNKNGQVFVIQLRPKIGKRLNEENTILKKKRHVLRTEQSKRKGTSNLSTRNKSAKDLSTKNKSALNKSAKNLGALHKSATDLSALHKSAPDLSALNRSAKQTCTQRSKETNYASNIDSTEDFPADYSSGSDTHPEVAEKNVKKRRVIKKAVISEDAKLKRENTLKLIQNSNLCLFLSFQNKFGCYYCKNKYPEISQLREHSLIHTNTTIIDRKIINSRGLSYKNAEISDLQCNMCSENATDLAELSVHLENKHEIQFNKTQHYLVPYKLQNGFKCVCCDAQFKSYLRLSIHMNTHYTNNVCEICGQSFINRLGLRAHIHSQHKQKKCSHCNEHFMTASEKTKHLRLVHNIRQSKRYCNLCDKTFRYTYMLVEHKIQEHGLKRPIADCVVCGKTFLGPNNLKYHVRSVHNKERNYPCSRCSMRFFTKFDQKRHEITHDDVRSFSCSYCETKFKSKESWRRHVKRQHGHVFGGTS